MKTVNYELHIASEHLLQHRQRDTVERLGMTKCIFEKRYLITSLTKFTLDIKSMWIPKCVSITAQISFLSKFQCEITVEWNTTSARYTPKFLNSLDTSTV